MFSHAVIFWTKDGVENATDRLVDGINQYLKPIPGVEGFHVGRMASSHRDVVDQSYQVGLHILFKDKPAQDAYQDHPMHIEFVEKVFKEVADRVIVYDFEG